MKRKSRAQKLMDKYRQVVSDPNSTHTDRWIAQRDAWMALKDQEVRRENQLFIIIACIIIAAILLATRQLIIFANML